MSLWCYMFSLWWSFFRSCQGCTKLKGNPTGSAPIKIDESIFQSISLNCKVATCRKTYANTWSPYIRLIEYRSIGSNPTRDMGISSYYWIKGVRNPEHLCNMQGASLMPWKRSREFYQLYGESSTENTSLAWGLLHQAIAWKRFADLTLLLCCLITSQIG